MVLEMYGLHSWMHMEYLEYVGEVAFNKYSSDFKALFS